MGNTEHLSEPIDTQHESISIVEIWFHLKDNCNGMHNVAILFRVYTLALTFKGNTLLGCTQALLSGSSPRSCVPCSVCVLYLLCSPVIHSLFCPGLALSGFLLIENYPAHLSSFVWLLAVSPCSLFPVKWSVVSVLSFEFWCLNFLSLASCSQWFGCCLFDFSLI